MGCGPIDLEVDVYVKTEKMNGNNIGEMFWTDVQPKRRARPLGSKSNPRMITPIWVNIWTKEAFLA